MAKKKGGPKTGKKSKHRFSFKEKAAAPEKKEGWSARGARSSTWVWTAPAAAATLH